ncbi:DUF58 domain-containing protein [Falsiroseomonas oryziterrae]|uniref:DUF58 domain-containing protein n=1 Tax=Falsiroseomonas oryziterrae TaxID=2911368 RepID=UPI001F3E17F3|nr:DUF58 domain-containing protein [Roseomonas sp. NPKOSM-4]
MVKGQAALTVPWAEQLGAALPPLLVEAERVAATVMPGLHGRRRAGPGEAFWQFRAYVPGDQANRIDWRQSGKSDRLFIRETEWEAAQTVALWIASGPGMEWRSSKEVPTKTLRAQVLLLALASLLLRGGERVRLFGLPRPFAGRPALPAIADSLAQMAPRPEDHRLARHARAVLFGDFWEPLETTRAAISALAAQGVRGHVLQVLDPAEETLPYAGRVRFEGVGAEIAPALVPRVEAVREVYAERVQRHRAALAALAQSAGWSFATHRTDQPPETALLALHQVLAPA